MPRINFRRGYQYEIAGWSKLGRVHTNDLAAQSIV